MLNIPLGVASRVIATVAAVTVTIASFGQTSQRITAGKANEYGLIYTLPTTVVDIYLSAELTEETPGEFYNYARRHLGITNAITEATKNVKLTDAVLIAHGEPDSEQQWLAQFKGGTAASMLLTSDNIPLCINSDAAYSPTQPMLPESTDWSTTALDGAAAAQAVTADMARSSSTSKRAELAAQRIFELREMRSDIISGQADNMPGDGTAMQLVLDNISAQENALTAMFTGVRRSRTVVAKVSVTPDTIDVTNRVIARVSAIDGLIDADDLSGMPVTVDMHIVERGQLPTDDRGKTKSFPKGGVAYRIPGTVKISVNYDGNTVASASFPTAQLGVVFGLDPSLFTDKRNPSKVVFDPTCGALVELAPVTQE